MDTNNGVQLGSVNEVTNISPSSRSASSMFKMTRARPSITPEEQPGPHSFGREISPFVLTLQ